MLSQNPQVLIAFRLSLVQLGAVHKSHGQTIISFVKTLHDGDTSYLGIFSAIMSVDVQDTALLHVAAVLDTDLKNARLQAWGTPCNWNDVLAILRKLHPEHEFIQDLPNMSQVSLSTDVSEPLALMKKWGNQEGLKSLEQCVEENSRPLAAWAAES